MPRPAFRLVCACVLALLPCLVQAQDVPFHPISLTPPATDGPTTVWVGIHSLEVLDIDAREETFELEADFEARWWDSRLAFDESQVGSDLLTLQGDAVPEALKSHVWWPDFEITDGRGTRDRMHVELEISSDGEVYYRERMVARIKQDFDLSSFPFDTHTISLSIQPFSYAADKVRFEVLLSGQDTVSWEPTDWTISDVESFVAPGLYCTYTGAWCSTDEECVVAAQEQGVEVGEEPPVCYEGFADLTAQMQIARDPAHYIWKIILPLMLIVLVSSGVFWLSLQLYPDPGDRMTIAFTGLLTIVAFDFVASDSLPKLWYTTALDRILILSYFFLGLNVLENIFVVAFIKNKPERAEKIDKVARWLFPWAYLAVLLFLLVSA